MIHIFCYRFWFITVNWMQLRENKIANQLQYLWFWISKFDSEAWPARLFFWDQCLNRDTYVTVEIQEISNQVHFIEFIFSLCFNGSIPENYVNMCIISCHTHRSIKSNKYLYAVSTAKYIQLSVTEHVMYVINSRSM